MFSLTKKIFFVTLWFDMYTDIINLIAHPKLKVKQSRYELSVIIYLERTDPYEIIGSTACPNSQEYMLCRNLAKTQPVLLKWQKQTTYTI